MPAQPYSPTFDNGRLRDNRCRHRRGQEPEVEEQEYFLQGTDTIDVFGEANSIIKMNEHHARARARAIHQIGGLEAALTSGAIPNKVSLTVSEGVVLGLLRQGVRK